jgi:hypothetical protein
MKRVPARRRLSSTGSQAVKRLQNIVRARHESHDFVAGSGHIGPDLMGVREVE